MMADVDAAGGHGQLGAHGGVAEAGAHMDSAMRTADSDVARQLMAMHTGGQVRGAGWLVVVQVVQVAHTHRSLLAPRDSLAHHLSTAPAAAADAQTEMGATSMHAVRLQGVPSRACLADPLDQAAQHACSQPATSLADLLDQTVPAPDIPVLLPTASGNSQLYALHCTQPGKVTP